MTKEKAIETFEGINELESIALFFQPGSKAGKLTIHGIKEASRMAIDALRAQQIPVKLDRSRWDGCYLCKGATYLAGDVCFSGVYYVGLSDFNFCPSCGRLLTEEARAELEKKLEV